MANSVNKKSQNLPRGASKTDKKYINVIKSSGTVLLFEKCMKLLIAAHVLCILREKFYRNKTYMYMSSICFLKMEEHLFNKTYLTQNLS